MWVLAGKVYVNLSHTVAARHGVRDQLGHYGQTIPVPTVTLYLALPGVKRTYKVTAEGEQATEINRRLAVLAFADQVGADDRDYAPRDMYTACE